MRMNSIYSKKNDKFINFTRQNLPVAKLLRFGTSNIRHFPLVVFRPHYHGNYLKKNKLSKIGASVAYIVLLTNDNRNNSVYMLNI